MVSFGPTGVSFPGCPDGWDRAGMASATAAGSHDVHQAASRERAEPKAAFARHVEPEIEMLLRVARTLTGSWPDAEDLVQDTLVRAYRGIGGFDGAHPRAWLLTILRNTNANSRRRRRPDLLDGDAELDRQRPAFGAASAPSPEQIVTDRVLGGELQRAVEALDDRFRVVLLLIDVDDLSYRDVADVLGIPVGTVLSRLSRARERIRVHLRSHPQPGRSS